MSAEEADAIQEIPEEISLHADNIGFEPQEFEKPELFNIKPFQMIDFPSDQQIVGFAINDHKMVITTASKKIFRWRFKQDPGCLELELQLSGGDFLTNQIMKIGENVGKQLGTGLSTVGNAFLDTVSLVTKPLFNANLRGNKKTELEDSKYDKIFLEPRGTHMVVSSDDGLSFHSSYIEEGLKPLSALNGRAIRFFIWGEITTQQFTNALLVSSENKFYSYSLIWSREKQQHTENLQRSLFQLPVEKKICDVKHIFKQGVLSLIIATDQSIYILSGQRDLDVYFNRYKEGGDTLKKSELQFKKSFGSMMVMYAQNILWTNGFKLSYLEVHDQIRLSDITNATDMKYAKKYDGDLEKAYQIQEQLYGIGLTRFHYYLLTFDTITIINIITQSVVTYFDLNIKTMGKVIGMVYDNGTQCFWIYCKNGVQRLNTEFEDQEMWKLLVEIKNYKDALEIAKKYDSPYFGHIAGLYADTLFSQKQYEEAARFYILSNKSYQEVFLQFSLTEDLQTLQALEKYLQFLLIKTTLPHQKQVLLGYILELMVARKCEKQQIQQFLTDHLQELNEEVVDQVLQPHGLFDVCNLFAEMKNDLERLIMNYIIAEDYDQALLRLSKLRDPKQLLDIITKYSYVLMKFKPSSTLDTVKQLQKFDPSRLIGALTNIPPSSCDAAIEFMEHCIEKLHISDRNFNNLYVLILIEQKKQSKIIRYLHNQQQVMEDKGYANFDLMLAQRTFKNSKLLLPTITILSMTGKFEKAIQMALKNNQIAAAKEIASKCEDNDRQKQLWIQIVVWMLDRGDENVRDVVQLTREVECLQVEDVLPHLNKNIKLDHFKAEICDTLLNYHDQVEKLKLDINGFYRAAESLKKEWEKLNNRSIFVSRKKKCEECFRALFAEEYVVFECSHTFHRDCLWQQIHQNQQLYDPKKVAKIQSLYIQLTSYETSLSEQTRKKANSGFQFFNSSKEQENKIVKNVKPKHILEMELNEILTNDCPICGMHVIDSILLPLDGDESKEMEWII